MNTLGKRNERSYSDPSVMFSSAEACTPLITYKELEEATNYWNKSNILGKGGFGVVFKGIWKNTAVAIKRLETQVSNYLLYLRLFRINNKIYIVNLYRKTQNRNLIFWKLKDNNL